MFWPQPRKKNPAVSTAFLVAALFTVFAVGSHLSSESKKKAARKKVSPLRPTCPEGTVYDGYQCVAPAPTPFPSPTPPFPGPPPGPVDTEPKPSPSPTPEPTPEPQPKPDPAPGEGDAPNPLPQNLVPAGPGNPACIKYTYNRIPIRVPLDVFQSWNLAARDWTRNKLYYMNGVALAQFVELVSTRYQTWPSLRNVVVRDALTEMTGCNWYIDDLDMSSTQQNLFAGAVDLARAVEADLQWSPPDQWSDLPMGYDDEILARPILGLPSPGLYNFAPGQIIELLVIDASLRFAEHVYARILGYDQELDCFEYLVIGTFQNRNVSPKFAHHHGIALNSKGCLKRTGGGAYRVYAPGVT